MRSHLDGCCVVVEVPFASSSESRELSQCVSRDLSIVPNKQTEAAARRQDNEGVTLCKEKLAITPLAKRSIAAAVNAYFSESLARDGTVGEEGPEHGVPSP
jgi:hypothetical protein